MLESSPAFLKCYECKRGPKQFSFLLCNHIICGKCISKNIQISDKYNLVKCSCGCLTYFNEENQIIQVQDSTEFRTKKANIRMKTQQDHHHYQTKSKKPVKKRKTFNSQDFKENGYQSLNHQRLTIPNMEMSQIFSLQTNISQDDNNSRRQQLQSSKILLKNGSISLKKLSNKLIGTENTLSEENSSGEVNEKEGKNKHINQFSTHYITENDNRQSFLGERKSFIIPNVKNLLSSITLPDNSPSIQKPPQSIKQHSQIHHKNDEQLHSRFQNEIEFMSIIFKKDLQQVQYQFNKCLDEIKNIYHSFQNSLRSLYAEQVITNKTAIALNLSDVIKEKYDKQIAYKFKSLKNNLLVFFHSFRHNQNLNSPKTPSILHITQFAQQKKKRNQSNETINYSQIIDDLENDCQSQTIKNNKVQKFQTVQEKLQRLTTKNNEIRNKQSKNHLNSTNSNSMKRVQTQNIHANINSHQNINFLGKQNLHRANYSFDEFTPEMNFRFSQKTHKRSNPLSFEKQIENKRRQVLYFSPSMPYCYKHLKEKKSEAKNYLSFIEQLCHEKKMNNHQELFKKVKQGNQIYEFRNRD